MIGSELILVMHRLQIIKMAGLLAVLGLVGGCAAQPPAAIDIPMIGDEKMVEQPLLVSTEREETLVVGPRPQLSEDIVYGVLAGEIAGQRGKFDIAARQYLFAAQLSQDKGIATRAARIAMHSRDHDMARRAAELLAEVDSNSVDAHELAGLLQFRAAELELAGSHFSRMIELFAAGQDKAFMRLGRLLIKEDDRASAIEVVQRLISRHSEIAESWYVLGLLSSSAQYYAVSEPALKQAIRLRPDWTEAIVLRGRVLAGDKRYGEAVEFLRAEIERRPDEVVLRMSLAQVFVKQGEHDAAFEAFKGLLQRDPGHVDALYALGLLSLEIGDLDAAHDYLSQLYERPARRIEAAFHLGVLEEMRKNLVQALSWYRQVDSSGKQLEAQIRSAGLLAKLGRLPEAQEQLQDLRRANASLAVRLFLAEGELLKQAGRPLDVVDLYERALQQHPGDTTLLYARALAGEDVGRLDILEHDLNEILSQHPDHADALNALGYTLANKTDRFQEAEKYITRALKISPESAAVMDSMGWLQYRLGKYEESVRYLRQAYELNDDSEIAAHLGEALLQLGHSDEARRILEAALLANPGAEDVQRILDQIQGQVQVTP